MTYEYQPKGVCAQKIIVTIEDNILRDAHFVGGCNGNLKGLVSLSVGLSFEELSDKLKGITCGFKDTSCPDQLVKAMAEAISHDSL